MLLAVAALPPTVPAAAAVDIVTLQSSTSDGDASAYEGQTVTTTGVVVAVFGRAVVLADPAGGPWSGIVAYAGSGGAGVTRGDRVDVTGVVEEYFGLTELASNPTFTVLERGVPEPAPVVLTTGAAATEAYESVLVRVNRVTVADASLGFGEWSVDDGSGALRVDDKGSASYTPRTGAALDHVTGPLWFSFGDFKLEPRDDPDLGTATGDTIMAVQGSGAVSPLVDATVTVRGIVTAAAPDIKGFFIQDANGDGDPATSDGVFVYAGNRAITVTPGDDVQVTGSVVEFFDLTEIKLTTVNVLGRAAVPAPIPVAPAAQTMEDAATYFEPFEGMLVTLDDARVVGPTNRFGEFQAVAGATGLTRVHQQEPATHGAVVGVADGVGALPAVKVGDAVATVTGPLDYGYGQWRIHPAPSTLAVTAGPDPDATITPAVDDATGRAFSVVSFNIENFFDDVDDDNAPSEPVEAADAYERKRAKIAAAIADLGHPDVVAVQEAESAKVLRALAAEPALLVANYDVVLVDGEDPRGIDVGYLVRGDRATVLDATQHQGCAPNQYPFSGRKSCPVGNGVILFHRPPLALTLRVPTLALPALPEQPEVFTRDVTLIVNHFKSMGGGVAKTSIIRQAQADFVADLTADYAALGHDVIVLGDLNAYHGTPEMEALGAPAGLEHLLDRLPLAERYTYIYQGVSGVLDHVLATPDLAAQVEVLEVVRFNVDHAAEDDLDAPDARRASDHDPVRVVFRFDALGALTG